MPAFGDPIEIRLLTGGSASQVCRMVRATTPPREVPIRFRPWAQRGLEEKFRHPFSACLQRDRDLESEAAMAMHWPYEPEALAKYCHRPFSIVQLLPWAWK